MTGFSPTFSGMAADSQALDLGAWATRLDDRGVLVKPVGEKPWRPDPTYLGEPRIADDGWKDYEAIQFKDGDSTLEYRAGDACYFTPMRKGRPSEIGVIQSFYSDKNGYPYVMVQWLWRPEMIRKRCDDDLDPHELLLGDNRNENPWESMEM